MSAAVAKFMSEFSVEKVIAAYKETQLRPARGEWTSYLIDEGDDEDEEAEGPHCGCAATAVACRAGVALKDIAAADGGLSDYDDYSDPAELIAEHLSVPEGLVWFFARGFDGDTDTKGLDRLNCTEEDCLAAWKLGQEVATALTREGMLG